MDEFKGVTVTTTQDTMLMNWGGAARAFAFVRYLNGPHWDDACDRYLRWED